MRVLLKPVLCLTCDHCHASVHVSDKRAQAWVIVERRHRLGAQDRVVACSPDHARRAARKAGWRAHTLRAKYLWGGPGILSGFEPHLVSVCTTCGQAEFREIPREEYERRKKKGMPGGWVGLPSEDAIEGECPGNKAAKTSKKARTRA